MVEPPSPCQPPGTHRCCICEDAIPYSDGLLQKDHPEKVCRNFDCQRLYKQKQNTHPGQFAALVQFHRDQIRARREKENALKAHRQHIESEEAALDQAALTALLTQQPALVEHPPFLVPIPRGIAHETPQPQIRIDAYRAHLENVIEQGFACTSMEEIVADQHRNALEAMRKNTALFNAEPQLEKISDALCTFCKGGCCSEGATHAFISAVTIRRRLDENPDLTPDQVLQEYLAYLPAQALENSCVNQTRHGCALPRELRSDVCNSFYCEPLRHLQRQWTQERPAQVFAIQHANHCWNRYDSQDGNPIVATRLIDVENI